MTHGGNRCTVAAGPPPQRAVDADEPGRAAEARRDPAGARRSLAQPAGDVGELDGMEDGVLCSVEHDARCSIG